MTADTEELNNEDASADIGGTYVAPSAKVRLPESVTKLRKRTRTSRNDGTTAREA